MIARLFRRWRIRRTYKQLCEAMNYSKARQDGFARWRNRR